MTLAAGAATILSLVLALAAVAVRGTPAKGRDARDMAEYLATLK